jgi:hypothetical protein
MPQVSVERVIIRLIVISKLHGSGLLSEDRVLVLCEPQQIERQVVNSPTWRRDKSKGPSKD